MEKGNYPYNPRCAGLVLVLTTHRLSHAAGTDGVNISSQIA